MLWSLTVPEMTPQTATSAPRHLALVTGASSGLGADLARELARAHYDLVLVARRERPMQALAAELAGHGVRVTVIPANLGVIGAASRLFADLERRRLEEVDVLVNNAGFGDYAVFVRAEPTKLSEMIHLNITVPTELTRTFLPGMIARGQGRVLFVGALAGFADGPGAAVYQATKAFVLRFGEALAGELRGSKVTVTILCPGPMPTEFAAAAGSQPGEHLGRPGLMASAKVAQRGYAALKNGRLVSVPGATNKVRAAYLCFASSLRTCLRPLRGGWISAGGDGCQPGD